MPRPPLSLSLASFPALRENLAILVLPTLILGKAFPTSKLFLEILMDWSHTDLLATHVRVQMGVTTHWAEAVPAAKVI